MARLNGFFGSTLDTVNASLQAKAGYVIYVFRQGGNAGATSAGVTLTLRAGDGANFANGDRVQVGTDAAKARLITAGGGTDSLTLASAVSVTIGQRILNIGTVDVNPVTLVYNPNGSANAGSKSTIFTEDNDAATAVANSKLTSDADGVFFFFATDQNYDLLIQSTAPANLRLIASVSVGNVGSTVLLRDGSRSVTGTFQFDTGVITSNVASSGAATAFDFRSLAGLVSGDKLFSLKNNGILEVFFDHIGRLFVDADLTTKSVFGLSTLSVTKPILQFGATDYIQSDRAQRTIDLFLGGVSKFQMAGTGATGTAKLNGQLLMQGALVHALTGTGYTDFADLAATPNVDSITSFRANNSGATVITDFSNGQNGQVIRIFFANGNTTINNTATIKNRTGANITPGANTTRTYMMLNAIWYEQS